MFLLDRTKRLETIHNIASAGPIPSIRYFIYRNTAHPGLDACNAFALILLPRYNDESADNAGKKWRRRGRRRNRELLLQPAFVPLSAIFHLQTQRHLRSLDHSPYYETSASCHVRVRRPRRPSRRLCAVGSDMESDDDQTDPGTCYSSASDKRVLAKVAHNHGFSLRNEAAGWIRTP